MPRFNLHIQTAGNGDPRGATSLPDLPLPSMAGDGSESARLSSAPWQALSGPRGAFTMHGGCVRHSESLPLQKWLTRSQALAAGAARARAGGSETSYT
jgi:hypothetical protein